MGGGPVVPRENVVVHVMASVVVQGR